MLTKIVAVLMVVLTIAITIIVALQDCQIATKIVLLVAMLFVDGLTIGGCIHTFK